MKDQYQGNQSKFWTRKGDTPSVVGDFLGRIPTLALLSPQKGERICEAGSGAGFFARQVAREGAEVWGCDQAPDMLASAIALEQEQPLGITYAKADICKRLPYPDQYFDAVVCVGVLMHVSPEEMPRFAREVYRVLKGSQGRFVLSTTHPELYQASVGFKAEEAPWIRHEVTGAVTASGSYTLREFYRNKEGLIFEAPEVWSHTAEFLRRTFADAGFKLEHEQTTFVTAEALAAAGQSGSTGYPAFYQLLGRT